MTRIHLTPGATVLSAPTHDGLERITEGVGLIARFAGAAFASMRGRRGAVPAAQHDASPVAGRSPAVRT